MSFELEGSLEISSSGPEMGGVNPQSNAACWVLARAAGGSPVITQWSSLELGMVVMAPSLLGRKANLPPN